MFKNLKPYFEFSKNERVGIIVLLSIFMLMLVSNSIYEHWKNSSSTPNEAFLKKVKEFEQNVKIVTKKPTQKHKTQFKTFDPNTVSVETLEDMGVDSPIAKRLVNYRIAGGYFNSPIDLKKLYGLSEDLYAQLEPYIVIEPREQVADNKKDEPSVLESKETQTTPINPKKNAPVQVELNSADTLQLQLLNGIGAVLAKRIVAYRQLLGGYYNIKQLTEVYGITEEVIAKIEPSIVIDTSLLIKLNLNTATFKELNRHPYIEYAECKALFKYRDVMGRFNSFNPIIKENLMSKPVFEKVRPYLTLE